MAEYKLKSGVVLTDEDIEQMAEAIAHGELPGEWTGEAVVGRPRMCDEPLITTRCASESRAAGRFRQ